MLPWLYKPVRTDPRAGAAAEKYLLVIRLLSRDGEHSFLEKTHPGEAGLECESFLPGIPGWGYVMPSR